MINKTFKTLIKHPLIILAFAYNFILKIYEYISVKGIGAMKAQGVSYEELWSVTLRHIVVVSVSVLVYLFFFMPTLNNLIYEICTEKKQQGWLMRGFKRCTGRFAIFSIILIIATLIYLVVLRAAPLFALLLLPLMLFVYPMQSGLAAEDSFDDGMLKGVQYGRKYYFKMLGLFGAWLAVAFIVGFVDMMPDFNTSLTGDIIVSVIQAVGVAFMTIYSMYVYLDMKAKEDIAGETLDDEAINILTLEDAEAKDEE